MKKIIYTLATLLVMAVILIAFTACAGETCAHQWGPPVVVESPTCSTGGYSISTCDLCGETTPTVLFPSDHTYAEEWSFDGTYHWHELTCQHAGQVEPNRTAHTFDGGRYCVVCGTVKATQGLSYSADAVTGTYIVTGCKGTFETEIVVAKYYNNTLIAAVGDSAFANSATITSVYLQEYITRVGDLAFSGSKLITEVTFSRGLEYIGSQIFKGCDSLDTLVFLGTLEEFLAIEKAEDWDDGNGGFFIKCSDGVIPPHEHTYSDEWNYDGTYHWHEATCKHAGQIIIDRAAHEYDGGRYCTVCGTIKATQGLSYVADATSGTYTVIGCSGTFDTDIVVAKYYNNTLITAVGESAFANSTTITSVYLQEYITYIGDYAFAGSKLITEVTLGKGVEYIGSQIFKGCDAFTTLVFRGTLAEFEAIEKAEDWDGGHVGFTIKCTDGEIPPPEHTFSDEWSYDSNYHWHKSTCGHDNIVSSYGAHVFEGSTCTSCGIIKASQGLSYRGDLTTGTYIVTGLGTTLEKDIVVARFYNNIEITGVAAEAFSGVKGLNSVHLQSYIRTVGDRAFADSTDLTSVTLTKGLEYIGSEIFAGCTSLTEVIFQGSLAEWNAIEKAEDWNAGHTGYVIKFFGDVEIQM